MSVLLVCPVLYRDEMTMSTFMVKEFYWLVDSLPKKGDFCLNVETLVILILRVFIDEYLDRFIVLFQGSV